MEKIGKRIRRSSLFSPQTPEALRERVHHQTEYDIEHKYNGRWGYNGYSYHNPSERDREKLVQRMIELDAEGKKEYLNPLGEITEKYVDLDVYYSSTQEKPRRLIVQATPKALHSTQKRHWRTRELKGHVPFVIKLSEFCLNPLGDYDDPADFDHEAKPLGGWRLRLRNACNKFLSIILVMSLAWIIQVLLSVALIMAPWNDDGQPEVYDDYDNVLWTWPKHAINILDQDPKTKIKKSEVAHYNVVRRLVVKDSITGEWVAQKSENLRNPITHVLPPYIFLSFSRASFPNHPNLRALLHEAAVRMLDIENANLGPNEPPVEAFWIDIDCVSPENEDESTKDINSICDAVRGAKRLYIVLPSDDEEEKLIWGRRLWTLPEALLAANKLRTCIVSASNAAGQKYYSEPLTLTDMYSTYWALTPPNHEHDSQESSSIHSARWAGLTHDDEMSLLVKHFTGTISLSDIQLFSLAVQALARRQTSEQKANGKVVEGYTQTALAYAAMGLLAYRIVPDNSDSNFHAIARLSMINDNSQLLERLACLFPLTKQQRAMQLRRHESHHLKRGQYLSQKQPRLENYEPDALTAGSDAIIRNMADPDQFMTHLWDIKPLCQVVGVDADVDSPCIILDRCNAVPIRWKQFPQLRYVKDMRSFRDTLASQVVFYGTWFFTSGFYMIWGSLPLIFAIVVNEIYYNDDANYDSFFNIGLYYVAAAIALACGWIISLFSPIAVRQLCNGRRGFSRHLVGFEGVMPLHHLEKTIFGNYNKRLTYAPSSTPFTRDFRDEKLRCGREPDMKWIEDQLEENQRLFTIVDTGDNTVTIIAAERPPIVALIAGREGGMLRALLCSWRFENNCFYRESIMRMRSSIEDLSYTQDWMKVSLANQGDFMRARQRRKHGEMADAAQRYSSTPTAESHATATSGISSMTTGTEEVNVSANQPWDKPLPNVHVIPRKPV